MSDAEEGRRLAEALISSDRDQASQAESALADASAAASDAAALALARWLRSRGPEAGKVCIALARADAPRFGPQRHADLIAALAMARRGELEQGATRAFQAVTARGADPAYERKREQERGFRPTSLGRRLLSVATRAWVLAIGLPVIAVMVVPAVIVGGAFARYVAIGGAGLVALFVVIDALVRRCPACRALLAGELVALEHDGSSTEQIAVPGGTADRTRHSYRHSWRCTHCQHRWTR